MINTPTNRPPRRGGPHGFTLVEMLIVIGIIGILTASLIGSFGPVKTMARQTMAQNIVSQTATAMNLYIQQYREWPDIMLNRTEFDADVCWALQQKKLLDLTTRKQSGSEWIVNVDSLDRFGLLDPWGRAALKRNPKMSSPDTRIAGGTRLADHRLQYRLDQDFDGYVDASEGSPQGVRIRGSVVVWSRGPDGQDDFQSSNPRARNRYPYDDRLSWNHGTARKEK